MIGIKTRFPSPTFRNLAAVKTTAAATRRFGAVMLLWYLSGCTYLSQDPNTRPNPPVALEDRPEMMVPLQAGSIDLPRLATAIFQATNDTRRRLGLRQFERLAALDHAADLQASSNALNQAAVHTNIVIAWATPYDRVTRFGLRPRMVAENAATLPLLNFDPTHGYIERESEAGTQILDGQTSLIVRPHTYASFARVIVEAWMNSPGHRANIVNPEHRYLGCSARPTKSVTGFDMITSIQVFYTPMSR